MIKLPKKIVQTIQRELGTTNITFIEDVYINHIFKPLSVHLIALRIQQNKNITLVRYFGDNSFSICGLYDQIEIVEEIKNQVEKLW